MSPPEGYSSPIVTGALGTDKLARPYFMLPGVRGTEERRGKRSQSKHRGCGDSCLATRPQVLRNTAPRVQLTNFLAYSEECGEVSGDKFQACFRLGKLTEDVPPKFTF